MRSITCYKNMSFLYLNGICLKKILIASTGKPKEKNMLIKTIGLTKKSANFFPYNKRHLFSFSPITL